MWYEIQYLPRALTRGVVTALFASDNAGMRTTLKYVFPWVRGAGVSPRESFTLLDGAMGGFVQRVSDESGGERFAAMFGAHDLGLFDDVETARAAVERAATDRINQMLAIILPADVKAWLTSPA